MTEADQYKLAHFKELALKSEGIEDLLALWEAAKDLEEKADIWHELGECSLDWETPEVRVPLLKWMYTFRKTVRADGGVWVKPSVYAEEGYGSLSWEKFEVRYCPPGSEDEDEDEEVGLDGFVLRVGEEDIWEEEPLNTLTDYQFLLDLYRREHHFEYLEWVSDVQRQVLYGLLVNGVCDVERYTFQYQSRPGTPHVTLTRNGGTFVQSVPVDAVMRLIDDFLVDRRYRDGFLSGELP